MKVEKEINKSSADKKKNRFLLIFICIFLSIVILFGIIFGIIAAVNQGNKVARFGSVGIDEGEARYLASYYKNNYLMMLSDAGVKCDDTVAFWSSEAEGGVTWGELLSLGYRDFVSGLLISIQLFEKETSLAAQDKEKIKEIAERPFKRYGTVEEFNKISEKYGFDYDDYKSCAEILYKAAAAKSYFVGADGKKLSAADCQEYLEKYSRVSLLFLYDETLYFVNSDGETENRPLTDEEKAEREAIAERLRSTIAAIKTGEGDRITPEMFIDVYYPKSDSDQDMRESGYYLKRGARSTDAFAENYPEVVSKALEMQVGEYAEVECKVGTCFIYIFIS